MNQPFILYQDKFVAAIYKPSGFHVVPHEQAQHRVSREFVLMYAARDLLNQYVYPVHRLDAGTSGVVLFALQKESARELAQKFQFHDIEKTYEVVVRGYVPEKGRIDLPLELDSTYELVPAITDFVRLKTLELPVAVGKRNPTARYSLVQAHPRSGRFHQIRRHFGRKSHPVLGDAAHGDSKHNRFFREELGIAGLCLRAKRLELQVSWSLNGIEGNDPSKLVIESPVCEKWQRIHSLFA